MKMRGYIYIYYFTTLEILVNIALFDNNIFRLVYYPHLLILVSYEEFVYFQSKKQNSFINF